MSDTGSRCCWAGLGENLCHRAAHESRGLGTGSAPAREACSLVLRKASDVEKNQAAQCRKHVRHPPLCPPLPSQTCCQGTVLWRRYLCRVLGISVPQPSPILEARGRRAQRRILQKEETPYSYMPWDQSPSWSRAPERHPKGSSCPPGHSSPLPELLAWQLRDCSRSCTCPAYPHQAGSCSAAARV